MIVTCLNRSSRPADRSFGNWGKDSCSPRRGSAPESHSVGRPAAQQAGRAGRRTWTPPGHRTSRAVPSTYPSVYASRLLKPIGTGKKRVGQPLDADGGLRPVTAPHYRGIGQGEKIAVDALEKRRSITAWKIGPTD